MIIACRHCGKRNKLPDSKIKDGIYRCGSCTHVIFPHPRGLKFVAIDFETADFNPDSACALSLVRVEGSFIVKRVTHLIRPPRQKFVFSRLHGITWEEVAAAPTFGELWPQLTHLLEDIEFMAAHNADFDRRVLKSCCEYYGLKPPSIDFKCTVQMSRRIWRIYPTRLPDVCRKLGIPLKHHDAASDAEACALIVIRALHSE